jgi:hypothetical protein
MTDLEFRHARLLGRIRRRIQTHIHGERRAVAQRRGEIGNGIYGQRVAQTRRQRRRGARLVDHARAGAEGVPARVGARVEHDGEEERQRRADGG